MKKFITLFSILCLSFSTIAASKDDAVEKQIEITRKASKDITSIQEQINELKSKNDVDIIIDITAIMGSAVIGIVASIYLDNLDDADRIEYGTKRKINYLLAAGVIVSASAGTYRLIVRDYSELEELELAFSEKQREYEIQLAALSAINGQE